MNLEKYLNWIYYDLWLCIGYHFIFLYFIVYIKGNEKCMNNNCRLKIIWKTTVGRYCNCLLKLLDSKGSNESIDYA